MSVSTIERSIDVNVPARTAYNQWTQFESFPAFMTGVRSVRQLNDRLLRWQIELGGRDLVFHTEITEQIPDKRIAWRSLDGRAHSGVLTFHRLSDETVRVMLQMSYEAVGFLENLADLFGILESRVNTDLVDFKYFIERRGAETGGWRGAIERPEDRAS